MWSASPGALASLELVREAPRPAGVAPSGRAGSDGLGICGAARPDQVVMVLLGGQLDVARPYMHGGWRDLEQRRDPLEGVAGAPEATSR